LDEQVFTLINITVMTVVMWAIALSSIPFFIWLERKGSAIIQDRIGPNRAGILGFRLLGFIHNFSDTLKLLLKESITPSRVNRFYYFLAPLWAMTISLLPLLLVPLAAPVSILGHTFRFQAADFGVGILFVLCLTSLGVFGTILAGWASNNKLSLLGTLRASAQMISYELSIGLALAGLLMAYQTAQVSGIVAAQGGLVMVGTLALPLPNWGLFLQPVGFLLFLVAGFAETNRIPFDLAEGESELVAGYHVEYSSVKFALFFMAEYVNMAVVAFLVSTLFLGGYQVPFATADYLNQNPAISLSAFGLVLLLAGLAFGVIVFMRAVRQKNQFTGMRRWEPFLLSAAGFVKAALGLACIGYAFSGAAFPAWAPPAITALLQFTCLLLKVFFFCWLFIWVRWTLPRFRYDQLMGLGWKLMLPVALLNLLATGIVILIQK
jgi:NADH-quinone oxidoreductase subunit H